MSTRDLPRRFRESEEPLSAEDWQAIREGEAAIARGELVTLDDLRQELDL